MGDDRYRAWCAGGTLLVSGKCPVECPKWTDGPPQQFHRVLFLRRGAFLHRLNGVEAFIDSTTVSVVRPGDDLQVAHPLGCGDLFSLLQLEPETVDEHRLRQGDFRLGDDLDLASRRLVTVARRGTDRLELGERVAAILDGLPAQVRREASPRWPAHRRLASRAAEVLATGGLELGLDGIASRLNCSPHHLSRVFRSVMGESMTSYRNRFRVRQVLADLQEGEELLRDLAARYGFADQAHMIKVVKRHVGDSPGTLKKLLRA